MGSEKKQEKWLPFHEHMANVFVAALGVCGVCLAVAAENGLPLLLTFGACWYLYELERENRGKEDK